MPECETEEGCEIEDLASDQQITQFIHDFELAKALQNLENPIAAWRVLKRLGCADDPGFHLRMESVYRKRVEKLRKNQKDDTDGIESE